MDMDTMMMEFAQQDYDSMKALLAQYIKEHNDLCSGQGLAKVMSKQEIPAAIKSLEEHIAQLEEDILNFEKTHEYVL